MDCKLKGNKQGPYQITDVYMDGTNVNPNWEETSQTLHTIIKPRKIGIVFSQIESDNSNDEEENNRKDKPEVESDDKDDNENNDDDNGYINSHFNKNPMTFLHIRKAKNGKFRG